MRGRLRTIKVEMGCLRCGFDECPEALEFHHRDGEVKLFNLGARLDASWSKIEAEIAKCDVLCANCHRMMSCSCDSHRRYT